MGGPSAAGEGLSPLKVRHAFGRTYFPQIGGWTVVEGNDDPRPYCRAQAAQWPPAARSQYSRSCDAIGLANA